MTRSQRVALVVILLSAAALRLTGLDWDGFEHHHPDERYIAWVATTIEFPSLRTTEWAAQWRPTTSTFNPFHWPPGAGSEGIVVLQDQPRDFAYGHVPLYLGVLATRLVERVAPPLRAVLPAEWSLTVDVLNGAGRLEFQHLTAVGRVLTALFDLATVFVLFLLGRRLYGVTTGLLAAALLAVAVLHVQLAHFFTADPYLTFFVIAALYFMVAAHGAGSAETGRRPLVYLLLAAAMVGLAVGSKFTAVLLLVPLFWTGWAAGKAGRRWLLLLWPSLAAFATFAITNPFALLDWTCAPAGEWLFAFLERSCYLQNVLTQNAMVRGQIDLEFTRQFAGTWPYLYQIEMLWRWGLGPILTLLGLIGLGWAVWGVVAPLRGRRTLRESATYLLTQPVVIVLLWVVPTFILTGSFYVKFIRYMQPLTPFLLLFGAAMLLRWRSVAGRRVIMGAALLSGALYALAFVAIYGAEHPWNAASRWVHENVAPGSLILSEQWDDYLPVTMMIDGQQRLRTEYENAELTWLSQPDATDNEAKLTANLDLLAEADYLTILSNRVYGVITRLPERYPLSGQYHQMLFDGALGYELVWVGGRSPSLFGISFPADTFDWLGMRPPEGATAYLATAPSFSPGRTDESFIVYDQPLTMIFRNTGRLTAEQMRAAFQSP